MEVLEITFNATIIRLVAFQVEDESQVWWDWVKASKNLEAMIWEEFRELFMGKYFLTSARHTKTREFLELKQGTMTMLEYVAKFIELAHFADDYVATIMAKVRKFEDGMKLSIRDKIVGLLLQDMNLMVKTTMAIKREVDDARTIRDAGVKDKRGESQFSSSSLGMKQRASTPQRFQGQGHGYLGQGQGQSFQDGRHFRALS